MFSTLLLSTFIHNCLYWAASFSWASYFLCSGFSWIIITDLANFHIYHSRLPSVHFDSYPTSFIATLLFRIASLARLRLVQFWDLTYSKRFWVVITLIYCHFEILFALIARRLFKCLSSLSWKSQLLWFKEVSTKCLF